MGKYTYKHLGHKLFSTPGVIDESKIVEIKLDPVKVTAKAMDSFFSCQIQYLIYHL